jgi:membrane-bound lytic murein transglycosylase B
MSEFYYRHDNATKGPVTLTELAELKKNGIISSENLVARVGATTWEPLKNVVPEAPLPVKPPVPSPPPRTLNLIKEATPQPVPIQPVPFQPAPTKGSLPIGLIIGIGLVALLAVGVGGFFAATYFGNSGADKGILPSTSTPTSELRAASNTEGMAATSSAVDPVSREQSEFLNQLVNAQPTSSVDFAQQYPEEFELVYQNVSDAFTREELANMINRQPSELDEFHLKKLRFTASPVSVKAQKQEHKDFVPILVNDKTVNQGLEFFNKYQTTLRTAMQSSGVRIEDILGVINWESKFGKYLGEYQVYKVFVGNLFYLSGIEAELYANGDYNQEEAMTREINLKRMIKIKKRAAGNLGALLKVARKSNFNPYEIQGSWGGAIGIPQFMPASMEFAADGDGDGKIDLNNMDDAIASVASFLQQHDYATKGRHTAFMRYNPEEMYARGVELYSDKIIAAGLTY